MRAASVLFGEDSAGAQPGCKAVAGYLFGLSGELAVKEIMRASGMRPLPATQRYDDPFYAHFPYIKTLLRDNAKGRRAGELLSLAEDGSLFQDWNTDMRYGPTAKISEASVTRWKQSAEDLLERMSLP